MTDKLAFQLELAKKGPFPNSQLQNTPFNMVVPNQLPIQEERSIDLSSSPLLNHVTKEIHKNYGTPFELGLMTALSVISISCQNLIDVELPRISEKVPTSLMIFIIAESGEGKSIVKKKLFEAIQQFEIAQLDLYEQQNLDWQADKSIIQNKKKVLEDAIRKLTLKGENTLEQEQKLKELLDYP